MQDEPSKIRSRLLFAPRFSIRALLRLFVIVAVATVGVQVAQSRRSVTKVLLVPNADAKLYEPYLDALAKENTEIAELRVDRRTNTIVVVAQARNIDPVVKKIKALIADPTPLFGESSIGLALKESQNLIAAPSTLEPSDGTEVAIPAFLKLNSEAQRSGKSNRHPRCLSGLIHRLHSRGARTREGTSTDFNSKGCLEAPLQQTDVNCLALNME